MDKRDDRVRERAEELWREAGSPAAVGPEHYWEQASDLVALEENPHFGQEPVRATGPYGEPVEEAEIVENLGEFPTLTDEGEQTYPPEPEASDTDVPHETPEPGPDLKERLPDPDADRVRRRGGGR